MCALGQDSQDHLVPVVYLASLVKPLAAWHLCLTSIFHIQFNWVSEQNLNRYSVTQAIIKDQVLKVIQASQDLEAYLVDK